MRLAVAALVVALFVPASTATSPTPPWKFDIDVSGSGELGSTVTIVLDVLSRHGGQNVRLELEVPSSLSPPETAAHTLDFEKGQRRILKWETTTQRHGFWAAQVIFTADQGSYGDPLDPDVNEYSHAAGTVYGLSHKTLSRVSTDPMDIIPGPAEGRISTRFSDDGNGHFEINATFTSTTEWVRWGNVTGSGNILNARNVTHGRGFRPLSLTLRDTLPPGWAAFGGIDFTAMPFWDSARPVTEPSYTTMECQGISVAHEETGGISFSDQLECPRATSSTPGPGWAMMALALLASVVIAARRH